MTSPHDYPLCVMETWKAWLKSLGPNLSVVGTKVHLNLNSTLFYYVDVLLEYNYQTVFSYKQIGIIIDLR